MVSAASPLLVVLSGPSGVGKDSALQALKELGRPWYFAVTATTRPARESEVDGVDYDFLSRARFEDLLAQGGFLEHADVYGHLYGVPRAQISQALARGQDVIVKVDVQGTATIKRLAPQAVAILLIPSSLDELRSRLQKRGTELGATLERRLDTAQAELERSDLFDYQVLNAEGRLDEAVASIEAIITEERRRVPPRQVHL